MRREHEFGGDEALAVPRAEELLRLLLHLFLLLGDERDDVVEGVERRDPRIARAGEGLQGRHHDPFDPKRLVERRRGEREADGGAVPVRDDRTVPASAAPLHLEGLRMFWVDLGDDERHVFVHTVRLDVREDMMTGLRQRGFRFRRGVRRERAEADVGIELRARRLELYVGDRLRDSARHEPVRDVAVTLADVPLARRERADLEPGMADEQADEALPDRAGGAEDRDAPLTAHASSLTHDAAGYRGLTVGSPSAVAPCAIRASYVTITSSSLARLEAAARWIASGLRRALPP